MVANSFLGRSSNEEIIAMAADLFSKPSSISDFVNENNATSAPDINAEHASSINSNTTLEMNDVLETRRFDNKTEGSGSKAN